MKTINCPKCGNPTTVDIVNALDENGELFRCSKCNYYFRYTLQ
jgi:transcription elongation factor Elf1